MSTTLLVIGATGGTVGPFVVRHSLAKPSVVTKVLVRAGYETNESKKKTIDEFVAAGAQIVLGDAGDKDSLVEAFQGVDIIISALGGFELERLHLNIYEVAKTAGVKRIVPSQFGFEVLALPANELSPLLAGKLPFLHALIDSGIPYTIIANGAFSEWWQSLFGNPVDYIGDLETHGWISTTSFSDSARIAVDTALDPAYANKRVSIVGNRLTPVDIAAAFSKVKKTEYSLEKKQTIAEAEALNASNTLEFYPAFLLWAKLHWAKGTIQIGFEPDNPLVIDTEKVYGWKPETFEETLVKLYGSSA